MNTLVEEKIAESIVIEDVDAVTRGALFLDEHLPSWYKYIDLDTFSIHDGARCIVGQLEMEDVVDDKWFVARTGLPYSPDYGFCTKNIVVDGVVVREAEWEELHERWIVEILKRRDACPQH